MLRTGLAAGGQLTVAAGGPDPLRWVGEHRTELDGLLLRHGAVLVSGLPVHSGADVAAVRDALGLRPSPCLEQFAARRELGPAVYSAPDWAADREQCLHHEQGYAVEVPRVLLMAYLSPAQSGGAMLLGDTRAVLPELPADVVGRFRAEGWLLARNFRRHFGLSWASAFGVETPEEVERYCRQRRIDCEWLPDGTLRATQRRAAIVQHPRTREPCWFNDVAFFSQWSVDPEERGVLLAAFGPDGIPFNTCYGGGTPLGDRDWRRILDAYDAVLRRVDWQPGDLLLMDNILTAHGREPFTGNWEVAVAPAEPTTPPPG